MKKYSALIKTVFCLIILSCLSACAGCFFVAKSVPALIVTSVASVVIVALILLMLKLEQKRSEKLVCDLSDLIESISRLNAQPVFYEFDDSLTSKLQNQVLRLTETLKNNAERLSRDRDEIKSLISDIAHQLKTPVATLSAYGELLTDKNETDENRELYSARFSQSLERLSFLTDSLVKMSRLEGGVVALAPVSCSLNETILSAVMQAYEKAVKKNIEIKFDNNACLVTLCHDSKWSAEAIFNVIDNAIKYSPSGSVITLTLTNLEMYTRLDIADRGPGIAGEEQPKIFKRFYRGEQASGEEGSGIGLYLSRKILTEQGGYIKVSSSEKGSVFSLYFQN